MRNQIIAGNLRAARAFRNMQAKEVAFQLGIHLNTLYAWEQGKSSPRADTLRKLAQAYQVDVVHLIQPTFLKTGDA